MCANEGSYDALDLPIIFPQAANAIKRFIVWIWTPLSGKGKQRRCSEYGDVGTSIVSDNEAVHRAVIYATYWNALNRCYLKASVSIDPFSYSTSKLLGVIFISTAPSGIAVSLSPCKRITPLKQPNVKGRVMQNLEGIHSKQGNPLSGLFHCAHASYF